MSVVRSSRTDQTAIAFVALLAVAHFSCNQAILTAPSGSSITLFANPQFIPAYGGVSIISALVIEPSGSPVADGTVVQFFTNLGQIDEQGKTNDGVARVNLVADSRSGTATVRAFSGGTAASGGTTTATSAPASTTAANPSSPQSGGVTVTIGSALPANVYVTAIPTQIRSTDRRESEVVANVYDANGNPVQNVPLIFTVSTGGTSPTPATTEFMQSGGAPVFTDTNGRAEDTLLTRYDVTAVQKTVVVTATTPTNKSGNFTVVIN